MNFNLKGVKKNIYVRVMFFLVCLELYRIFVFRVGDVGSFLVIIGLYLSCRFLFEKKILSFN